MRPTVESLTPLFTHFFILRVALFCSQSCVFNNCSDRESSACRVAFHNLPNLSPFYFLRLLMASMETLYTALQDQIQSFEGHIRSCQQAFDIDTLYNVLLLLSPATDIQSLEQLEKLVESREQDGQDRVRITAGCDKCDIASYISWFVSYVQYLGSLKRSFDTKVVFPLCENLYVNDDSLDALTFGHRRGHGLRAPASVARTAKQLFSVRRKWALLLKGDTIDAQFFSPQSWLDVQGFGDACPFGKVLRLVPDLFHKGLATARLARLWVERHARNHGTRPVPSNLGSTKRGKVLAVDSLEHHGYNSSLCQPRLPQAQYDCLEVWSPPKASSSRCSNERGTCTCMRSASQGRNKLHEIRGELMSLLCRGERSLSLEAEIQEVNQSISNLRHHRVAKERELEALEQQLEKDHLSVPCPQRQAVLCELDALGRQLRLEEYRKSILQAAGTLPGACTAIAG
ncbi:uncharacterized protein LOC117045647 [Lacerta agilis]|uniref:uncharacterized protein LOC117045647 n=1 Tax=Lacerta agilis TaxID=80427 RepID=UPI0014193ACA|nr:uncharacterized protein LOC117045647 [Lacerta agilis]